MFTGWSVGITLLVLFSLGWALFFLGWSLRTAIRLDRLHIRVETSWRAMEVALRRRQKICRLQPGLTAVADFIPAIERQEREIQENELAAAIAQRVSPVPAELHDAMVRVSIARRFHTDAVRDTLALRRYFVVRLLRLHGTAVRPDFFEIRDDISPELIVTELSE